MCEQIGDVKISGACHDIIRKAGFEYLGQVGLVRSYRHPSGDTLSYNAKAGTFLHSRLTGPQKTMRLRQILQELV